MADGGWTPVGDAVPLKGEVSTSDFKATLDKVFGSGKWKQTSGYRSPAAEDRLRAEGAGTVRPGHVSAHSEGDAEDPGAFDFEVSGMPQAEAAKKLAKADPRFTKAFAEAPHGAEGEHVHAAVGLKPEKVETAADDWTPVGKPEAIEPPKPKRKTPLQYAQESVGALAHVPMEGFRQGAQAQRTFAEDFTKSAAPAKAPTTIGGMVQEGVREAEEPFKVAQDALGALGGGFVSGALKGVAEPFTNTLAAATGGRVNLDPQQVGDLASLAIPGAGEFGAERALATRAGAAGVGAETLRGAEAASSRAPQNTLRGATQAPASRDPEHSAAVDRLEAEGVRPAAHQRAGGVPQRIAESAKANPYTGPGIRAAERTANDSFNRALYNKVLRPIGEAVTDTAPVGRDGVGLVEKRLSDGYETLLPQIKIDVGPEFNSKLNAIGREAKKLPPEMQKQFKAIVDQEVRSHFGTGDVVDGKTFKATESELSRWTRGLRGSQDHNAREMAGMLDDVNGLIRDQAEMSAGPKLRGQLRGLNQSWAMFTRLQDAAARRQGGLGYITPGDLLAAVKKGDKSVRKGAFARGDALLQSFAEDADKVLSPRHGTSHTPEIQEQNRLMTGRGIIGGAMGGAAGFHGGPAMAAMGAGAGAAADFAVARGTNSLARALLEHGPPRVAPRNFLQSVDRRLARRSVPAIAASSGPPQQ